MMKRLFAGRFIRSIGYLLSVHLVALLFFFGLRVALFIATDYDFPKEISEDYALQSVAFLRGLWFDNVIACYILLLPLAVFWIAGWFGYTARWLYRSSAFFFIFFYSLCFIISAANIPYFAYFFKPINSSIFNWFDYAGTTAEMVFGETSYYLPIALGLTAIAAFAYITLRLSRTFFLLSRNAAPPANRWKAAAFTFVTGTALIGLCFFGIRGRRGYNPIKVSQAYYCNDAFLNQLGINPVFNLMTSAIDDNRKENRLLAPHGGRRSHSPRANPPRTEGHGRHIAHRTPRGSRQPADMPQRGRHPHGVHVGSPDANFRSRNQPYALPRQSVATIAQLQPFLFIRHPHQPWHVFLALFVPGHDEAQRHERLRHSGLLRPAHRTERKRLP